MMVRSLILKLGVAAMAVAVLIGSAAKAASQPSDAAEACHLDDTAWDAAALMNAESWAMLTWAPFGGAEYGWDAYLLLIQRELGTNCAPQSPVFAQHLATFQAQNGLSATGVFEPAVFDTVRGLLQERRPFLMARLRGECPEPPALIDLAYLLPEEEHADRLTRLLRRDVLDAYRRMAAAARAEVPAIAADPELLQIFSGWRDPVEDAARCARDGNCDGLRRAVCSPHRTGTAIDMYVGRAPGLGVDSTAWDSRLSMARSPAYLWLVKNAHRFGFIPYHFEPWHWEYVGEPAR